MAEIDYRAICLELFGTDDVEELKMIAKQIRQKNTRNAGRKRKFNEAETGEMQRLQRSGMTVNDIAKRFGTSRQIIGKYLNAPLPEGYTMRMIYMFRRQPCTTIDVDFLRRKIRIQNKTDDILHRAFGANEQPTWDDFECFLQERCFERLGGTHTHHVDVRIIAATNRDLESMVESGDYRRDLFYRLNVFPIRLPALRERKDDILPLASRFAQRFARANGREDARLSLAVMDMLQRYDWPGNVRELENVMERAVLLMDREDIILPQHLPLSLHGEYRAAQEVTPEHCCVLPAHAATLPQRVAELERSCIVEALAASGGHMGKAAQALGLTDRIMGLRMRKYNLHYQSFRTKAGLSGKKTS